MTVKHPLQQIMKKAILKASEAGATGLYPIAAVIVDSNGNILAFGQTLLTISHDPTAHAEIIAIRRACEVVGDRYLLGCWLYTTLEPCPMCTSAAIFAKMNGIVFGASIQDILNSKENGRIVRFSWSQITISSKYVIAKSNRPIALVCNFMRDQCKLLLLKNAGPYQ